ncbi:DMT family transporter [Enterovibrio norvegicus]|uniref:DMT family transporter n=1 Tax=Enterovibrio norvegicus TaxID=188144 RepID=UPI00036327E2|nr:DMT family transporter [Enterovibrio norvegicus]
MMNKSMTETGVMKGATNGARKGTKKGTKWGKAEMVFAMLLSGTLGVFVSESGQSALNVVFYRCLFGVLFLGTYAGLRGYLRFESLSRKDWFLTLTGGIALVANWCLLFASFSYAPMGVSTVAYHVQPIFVMVLAVVFLRETFAIQNWLWIALAFAGVVMIVGLDVSQANEGFMLGVLLSISAACLYAITTLITRQLKHIKPHLIATIQLSIGALILFVIAPLDDVPVAGEHWYWLLALGLLHTCIMYIFMYSAFQKLETSMLAVLAYIYPVVAVLVDYWVYGNVITGWMAMGILAILFAGFAMNHGLTLQQIGGALVGKKKQTC